MQSKNQKEAVVLPFPTPSNVVSLTGHRVRRGSPQILTEVVASEADRGEHGGASGVGGILIREVTHIDELSVSRDHDNNEPPDDLIA